MQQKSALEDILKVERVGKKNHNRVRSINDLYLTAKQLPQAIVKISSYGKGPSKVLDHLSYISRRGELDLEDQDGNLVKGLAEQSELIDEWSADFGDNKRSRDTLHLVLSAPPGSDSKQVKDAASAFLAQTFGQNHRYVFATHTDTKHPHVHCAIKLMGEEGRKLDPRKAMLDSWRKDFARACRERGIMVEASLRFERGLGGKSKKSAIRHMEKRGEKSKVDMKLETLVEIEIQNKNLEKKPWEDKMVQRNRVIRRRYIEAARIATQQAQKSQDMKQKNSATEITRILDEYAKNMPVEKSRYYDIKIKKLSGKGLDNLAKKLKNCINNSYEEYINIKQISIKELQDNAKITQKKQKETDQDIDI